MLRKQLLMGNWSLQFPLVVTSLSASLLLRFVFVSKIGWELRAEFHLPSPAISAVYWKHNHWATHNPLGDQLKSHNFSVHNRRLADFRHNALQALAQVLCILHHMTHPQVSSYCSFPKKKKKKWKNLSIKQSFCQPVHLYYVKNFNVWHCCSFSASVFQWEHFNFSQIAEILSWNKTLLMAACDIYCFVFCSSAQPGVLKWFYRGLVWMLEEGPGRQIFEHSHLCHE